MPHSLGKARDIHSLPLSDSTMLDLPRTRSGSFASSADWRLPGSSGHQSSLSERYGLHALHLPASVTVEPPLLADIVGCPGKRVNDGPPDYRFWDVAAIHEIDTKQREQTTVCPSGERLFGITAWPLYLQKRKVGVRRPWARRRRLWPDRCCSALTIVTNLRTGTSLAPSSVRAFRTYRCKFSFLAD